MNFLSGIRNEHGFKLDMALNFSEMSPGAKAHLQKVYACTSLCLAAAVCGSFIYLKIMQIPGFPTFVGSIGSLLYLRASTNDGARMPMRLWALGMFGFCNGHYLGPLLDTPDTPVYTYLLFASLTLATLYVCEGSVLYVGGILMSGLNILFCSNLLRMIGIPLFGIYFALVLFSVFILYDTQMISYRHINFDETDFISHSTSCSSIMDLLGFVLDLLVKFVTVYTQLRVHLSER